MYATVRIGIQQKKDALLVPATVLTREKANTFVFTLAENKAHKVPVKTGFTDEKKVEILSGIKGDEDLIVAGNRTLADGQPVHAVEGK